MTTKTKTKKKRKAVAGRTEGKARLNSRSMARAVQSAVGAPIAVAPVPIVAPSPMVTAAPPAAADPLNITFRAEKIVNGLPVLSLKPGQLKLWLTEKDVQCITNATNAGLAATDVINPVNGTAVKFLGFLSPEGKYYSNPPEYGHTSAAALICANANIYTGPYDDAESTLIDAGTGFIKFACYSGCFAHGLYWRKKPTAAQIKVMLDWFLKNNILPPDFTTDSNNC